MISMNLKSLRKRHKYTQEEVADKIGVSRQAVAKWENGNQMNLLVLWKIFKKGKINKLMRSYFSIQNERIDENTGEIEFAYEMLLR